MAAVPTIGRAAGVERPVTRGADATHDLYERFSGQIFGYCLHQLGSREEAEDAVQTTFMNAFRGLQRGIVPEVESAWLFKIAHNVCLSRRRSTWRRGKIEAPNNMEVLQEVIPARERVGDELIRLPDVLEKMPDTQRRAILLREWQGLSYREIAAELELSQAAVETLIFRARRALASGLEEEPVERSWRKRARHGIDAGGVLTALKALFTGGAAVKLAATAVVVATTAVAMASGHHHARTHAVPAARTPHTSSLVAVRPPHAGVTAHRAQQVVQRHGGAHAVAPSIVATTPGSAHKESTGSASAPVSTPVTSQPSTPSQPVETQHDNGNSGNAGSAKPDDPKPQKHDSPTAPADPAPSTPAAENPSTGHDKPDPPRQTQSVDPQPDPTTTASAPADSNASSDHGQASAPGQQKPDKPDKSNSGNANAGGNGNGHK